MKKEIETIIEVPAHKELKVKQVRICDDCGYEVIKQDHWVEPLSQCKMCHKDLCNPREKKNGSYCAHFVSNGSDYDDVFCKNCYLAGADYRKLEAQQIVDLEEAYIKWQKLCKQSRV